MRTATISKLGERLSFGTVARQIKGPLNSQLFRQRGRTTKRNHFNMQVLLCGFFLSFVPACRGSI